MPVSTTLDIVAQNQLNVLIHLAKADHDFAEAEREVIYRICREKSFPEDRLNSMIEVPKPIDSLGALSADQRFQYLMDCIKMVLGNPKIKESELIFCRSIAIKLGLKKTVIDLMIESISVLTPQQLKEKVFSEYVA